MMLFPLLATGVLNTGCKFAAGLVDTGGNFQSVSLTSVATQAVPVEKFTGVVDTIQHWT